MGFTRSLLLVIFCACAELPPPCDAATARRMEMDCFARVQAECVDVGIAEEACPVIAECDALADSRKKGCTP